MKNATELFINKLEKSIINKSYVCININSKENEILKTTFQIDTYHKKRNTQIEIIYKTNILDIYLEQLNIEYDGTDEYFCFNNKNYSIEMCFI